MFYGMLARAYPAEKIVLLTFLLYRRFQDCMHRYAVAADL